MNIYRICVAACFSLVFYSCTSNKSDLTLFQLEEDTGIDFINTVSNQKNFNIFNYRNFYNGGGVGIGDINNDGLDDVFMTANMSSNKLYLNKGNFKFEDITSASGISNAVNEWSTGVTMVDINSDGWLDIFVCNAGFMNSAIPESKLYINNKDLTFTEKAAQYGLQNKGGYATHAAFFDYDHDGDLDCFIINNSFIPVNTLDYANKRELRAKDWPVAEFLKGGGDHFLRNDKGKFIDISEQAGIHGSLISFGLGISVTDINGDGYPDVYVSNDFFERDYLYINQKNGGFKDEYEQYIDHASLASMGSDVGDINNDGYPDIFTTDMLPDDDYRLKTTTSFETIDVFRLKEQNGFHHQFMQNCLQLNNGNANFKEIAHYSGVSGSDWSWGALMFDADNNGYTDIYVCNGIYKDVTDQDFIDFFANDIIQRMKETGEKESIEHIIDKMPSKPLLNKMFCNQGNLKFADSALAWGFTKPSFSNGAAYGDLDNDGDLDLIINNVNEPSFVYKNNSRQFNKNKYLGIILKGQGPNTYAIGSTIKLFRGNQVLTREVMPSRGFQSSVSYKQIFGTGNAGIDSIQVIWPDNSFTTITNPPVDTVLAITQAEVNNLADYYTGKQLPVRPLMDAVNNSFDKHQENNYVDFYNDRNIPMMISREGPKAATGDVNGDGLDDVFICGSKGQASQLYVQTVKGFLKREVPVFDEDKNYEDVSALFFDCDNDGDLDLAVGAGGNTKYEANAWMENRLYKNDGKGNFIKEADAFPANIDNNAVIIANDFNNDGSQDLFVGSRSMTNMYGPSPQSFLLLNDGKGKFTDIAAAKNPDIAHIGLITGAEWADITGDSKKELVIVGEWMAPRIFSFNKDHFDEVKTNLDSLLGWWQSVAVADVNNDGKQDLVLGNFGDNFYLKPDAQNPVKIWIDDFDKNGVTDKIITRTVNKKDMPVYLKREVADQLTVIKKQNLKHEDYAKRSVQDLFPNDVINNIQVKTFNYTASCVAVSQGNGKFNIQQLPAEAQFSCINAIKCIDVNNDGYVDIVSGGNKLCFQPQFCQLDASYGSIMLNDGKGNFRYLTTQQSGVKIRGVIRDIQPVRRQAYTGLLFLVNNGQPVLFNTSINSTR